MRRNLKYIIIVLLIVGSVYCWTDEVSIFAGKWQVANVEENFRGTKLIEIFAYDGMYKMTLNEVHTIDAKLSDDGNIMFFKISGFGPDGPDEKLIIIDGVMVRFMFVDASWIKTYEYIKVIE